MPKKLVSQLNCDRCQRVWYEDADAAQAKTTVMLEAEIEGVKSSIKYECLCAGCRSTVKGLLDAIGKTIAKASPIRTAKKKGKKEKQAAAEDKPPSAATSSTPPRPAVVVVPSSTSSPAVARAGGAAAHPTR